MKSRAAYRIHLARCLMGAAFLATAATAARAAEWPSALNLSTLNGTTGFRLDGVAASDYSGTSVAEAGDINGDGFTDLVASAPFASPNGTYSGSSYVVFGKSDTFASAVNLSTLDGVTGFRLDGEAAGDTAGQSVAPAGDVNGDGFADLIVGAPAADHNGSNSGASYVVFGKATGFASVVNLSSLNGTTGFRLDGVAAGDRIGFSVAWAGDVNGDGFSDLIVGAWDANPNGTHSGSSYVVFGKAGSFASAVNLSSLDGATGFRVDGVAASDFSGRAVAGAGDVNGDGFSDLIIGAYRASPNGISSGSSYVVFGKAGAFASAVNLSSLDGTSGFRLDGAAGSDFSGWSVDAAGDVNGDGYDDVAVGAFGAYSKGSGYVVFGKAGGFASAINLSTLNATSGYRLEGVAANDQAGASVSSSGDINGDGFADLVVGAPGADPNGSGSGSSYVVFGQATGPASAVSLSTLNGTSGFRLDGVVPYDKSGRVVSDAGDVNGDGFADLIVSAYDADPNGSNSGSTYVVLGRAPDVAVLRAGTRARQHIGGGSFTDILIASGTGDVLEGRGNGDILVGDVSTTVSYAHASTGLVVNLANAANTGDAANDMFVAIANIEGSGHDDTLIGDVGANLLTGGKGKDTLNGGKGKDAFAYRAPNESPVGIANSDQIAGFEPGTASTSIDKIDLSTIDANTTKGGNQAFTFRGTSAFSGPGQVRLQKVGANLIIQGNVNASLAADFEIVLKGMASKASLVTAKDFKL